MAEFYPHTGKSRSSPFPRERHLAGAAGPPALGAGPAAGTGTLEPHASRWLGRAKLKRGGEGQGEALRPCLAARTSILPRGRPNKAGTGEGCWPVSVPLWCRPAQGHPPPVSDPRVRLEKEPEGLFQAVTPKTSSCPPTGEAGEGRFGGSAPIPRGQGGRGVPGRSLPGHRG